MPEKIDLRPKVLEMIQKKGPLIPRDLVKELGGDTFIIGAVLMQLKEAGKIKVSNTKVGGSPAYYILGQEEKLQELSRFLGEKDKKTFDLLKEKMVLRDYEQSPLVRVSLRTIRDFAIPLVVDVENEEEIFWKWYLLSDQNAEKMILQMITKKLEVPEHFLKTEKQEKLAENTIEKEKNETVKEVKAEVAQKIEVLDGGFLSKVKEFFEKNNIEVLEVKETKKKKEYEFVIQVPGSLGKTKYFCKALDKKKCNEGDLSTAYVKAQSKKYPLLFLSTAELNKKALEMIKNNEFENTTYNKI